MTQQEFTARYSYDPKSDQLGSGGFGSVYKAYDNEDDCFVALKIANVDPQHPEFRLRNEVAKAEHLKHKNVARYDACYTFTTFSGEIDIAVMRYYEHGSLDGFMRRGDLNLEVRYDILTQILEGIAYLHSHGIIHRDLKPQNVLMVHHAGRYIPKITDFGISKQLEDGESSLVSNSVLGGTRSYASPEQLCERALRKNTDLWSFGVIAYNMLLGELPFTTGTFSSSSDEGRSEQLRQVLSGKLPEGINHISEPWQSVIRGCLVVKGEERLQHAEDCLAIIRNGVAPKEDISTVPAEEKTTIIGVSVPEVDEKTSMGDVQPEQPKVESPKVAPKPAPEAKKGKSRLWLWLLFVAISTVVGYILFRGSEDVSITPQHVAVEGKYTPPQPVGDEEKFVANEDKLESGKPKETKGTYNGREWVDLGLSVKWATCNVGANSPEAYGDYYAWGETKTNKTYAESCSTYELNIGDIKGTNRDVAHVEWGGNWRMPTRAEFVELLIECTWDWTTQNGKRGYKVTSKINGNSIFLPAAGGHLEDYDGPAGFYWSSTPDLEDTQFAFSLYFYSGVQNTDVGYRSDGLSVRPVLN